MSRTLENQAAQWISGKFDIGEAPNPHALLFDHIKSISTLAVAFLGLSVGFAEKLTSLANFAMAPLLLFVVWGFLILTIVLVLLASVGLHKYLLKPPASVNPGDVQKYKNGYNRAATEVGLSGLFLALATGAFALFGALVLWYSNDQIDSAAAIEEALAATRRLPQLNSPLLRVDAFAFVENEHAYRITVRDEKSNETYLIRIEVSGRTTEIQKQP